MPEGTRLVRIDWPYSHDCGDGDIRMQLEAGGDEGPLLVLSNDGRGGSGRGGLVAVFRNVDWYLASLIDGEADFPRERWVGLVRGSERENGEAAVAALQRIANLVGSSRRTGKVRSRFNREGVKAVPNGALTDPVVFDQPVTVENYGDGFDDVARAYPMLSLAMAL